MYTKSLSGYKSKIQVNLFKPNCKAYRATFTFQRQPTPIAKNEMNSTLNLREEEVRKLQEVANYFREINSRTMWSTQDAVNAFKMFNDATKFGVNSFIDTGFKINYKHIIDTTIS